MEIPKGLNEKQVIDTITKIAKRLAPKFVFAGYEVEDIEQEAFLIGVSGLKNYDPSRPLENFMFTHINNRLKTFKRDNYYRMDYGTNAQKIQERKKSLLEPVSLDSIYAIYKINEVGDEAYLKEILDLIDQRLPPNLRGDYLKLQSNAPLSKPRKRNIIEVIEKIINGEELEDD